MQEDRRGKGPTMKWRGYRDEEGNPIVQRETFTGTVEPLPLEPSLKVSNHSPTGFEWGYMGSGPAQLALAILLDYGVNAKEAQLFHQDFKQMIIGRFDQHAPWSLDVETLRGWVEAERGIQSHETA